MTFPQILQFVFKHFTTVRFACTGVANAFYAQMIHMINCSEVFTKSSSYIAFRLCRQVPPKHFCFVGDVLIKLYGWKNLPCNSNMAAGQMVPISLL